MRSREQQFSDNWRVFCAVELPAAVESALINRVARLKQTAPAAQASWTKEGNIHLTVKFLGDIRQSSVELLSQAATQTVSDLAPFPIRVEETGVFPPRGVPRVLWIGVNDLEGRLGQLRTTFEDECKTRGFPKESRPFHPHLTIARLRNFQDARTLAAAHQALEFEPVEFAVSELLVIRSELSSAGSKYTTISRHRLAGDESGEVSPLS